jgi:hypothetical protein
MSHAHSGNYGNEHSNQGARGHSHNQYGDFGEVPHQNINLHDSHATGTSGHAHGGRSKTEAGHGHGRSRTSVGSTAVDHNRRAPAGKKFAEYWLPQSEAIHTLESDHTYQETKQEINEK